MSIQLARILASRVGIWICNGLAAAVLTLVVRFLAHAHVVALLSSIGINGFLSWVVIFAALLFVVRNIRLEVILAAGVTYLLSLLTVGPFVWLVLVVGCVGLYVAALYVLPILAKSKEAGSRHEKLHKLIELLEHRSEIGYGDFSIMTKIAEVLAFNEVGEDRLTIKQNFLRFGVAINAVPPSTTELPPKLAFVASKKMLYEMHRKGGATLPFYKAVPSLSARDVLRRLDEDEIPVFHEFCRNHPLCEMHNKRKERHHFFKSETGKSVAALVLVISAIAAVVHFSSRDAIYGYTIWLAGVVAISVAVHLCRAIFARLFKVQDVLDKASSTEAEVKALREEIRKMHSSLADSKRDPPP